MYQLFSDSNCNTITEVGKLQSKQQSLRVHWGK
jgi:hypothetical protein